jgi:hypothetical protein
MSFILMLVLLSIFRSVNPLSCSDLGLLSSPDEVCCASTNAVAKVDSGSSVGAATELSSLVNDENSGKWNRLPAASHDLSSEGDSVVVRCIFRRLRRLRVGFCIQVSIHFVLHGFSAGNN